MSLDVLGILGLPSQFEDAIANFQSIWETRRASFAEARNAKIERLKSAAAQIRPINQGSLSDYHLPNTSRFPTNRFINTIRAPQASGASQYTPGNFEAMMSQFRFNTAQAQATGGTKISELFQQFAPKREWTPKRDG